MTNESDLVPLHMHNLLTVGPAPWTDTRVPAEVWHVARAVYGTSTEDDDKRVYRTVQAALWKAGIPSPAVGAPQPEAQPRLTVRLCSFPESNGKRNWTALLVRAEKWGGLVGNCGGISVARGECWNRVAYEAECAKLLIGERDTEPSILDYGDDIQTPEEWAGEKRGGRRVAAPSAQAEPAKCPHTGQCHPGFCPCSDAKRQAEQKGSE